MNRVSASRMPASTLAVVLVCAAFCFASCSHVVPDFGATRSSRWPWRPGHSLEHPAASARGELGDFVQPAGIEPSSTLRAVSWSTRPSAGRSQRDRSRRATVRHQSAVLLPAAQRVDPGRRHQRRGVAIPLSAVGRADAAPALAARPGAGGRDLGWIAVVSTPGLRRACSTRWKAGCTRWCGCSPRRWPGRLSASPAGVSGRSRRRSPGWPSPSRVSTPTTSSSSSGSRSARGWWLAAAGPRDPPWRPSTAAAARRRALVPVVPASLSRWRVTGAGSPIRSTGPRSSPVPSSSPGACSRVAALGRLARGGRRLALAAYPRAWRSGSSQSDDWADSSRRSSARVALGRRRRAGSLCVRSAAPHGRIPHPPLRAERSSRRDAARLAASGVGRRAGAPAFVGLLLAGWTAGCGRSPAPRRPGAVYRRPGLRPGAVGGTGRCGDRSFGAVRRHRSEPRTPCGTCRGRSGSSRWGGGGARLRHAARGAPPRVALVQVHNIESASPAEPWLREHRRTADRRVYDGTTDSLSSDLESLSP